MDLSPYIPVFMVFLIPIIAVVGAFIFLITKTVTRSRLREFEIRERIAMIERGLVPPPEVDPKGFDRAMLIQQAAASRSGPAHYRHRRAGITLMGVGFGLMVLLGATADLQIGLGIGGFLAILGFAFFVNSLFGPPPDLPTLPAHPVQPPTPPEPRN